MKSAAAMKGVITVSANMTMIAVVAGVVTRVSAGERAADAAETAKPGAQFFKEAIHLL
jgi:hypothetical protein